MKACLQWINSSVPEKINFYNCYKRMRNLHKQIPLMFEIELHSIPQLGWSLRVGDLWLLPFFLISRLLEAGQSIWWDVHCWPYCPTFVSIWGSGPCRNDPTSSPPHALVGYFPDTLTGVSGPAVTSALQILPCSPLTLVWENKAPYLEHWTSSPCHNVHPVSGGCQAG